MHPMMAESSLPLSIPAAKSNELLRYQIISTMGNIIRQGCFKGGFIYISTRLLPKGQRFLLRIVSEDAVLHEGPFQTLEEY
jgi:hypothetical protein